MLNVGNEDDMCMSQTVTCMVYLVTYIYHKQIHQIFEHVPWLFVV